MQQDERQSLARETMRILNDWNIPADLQAILLGLPEDTRPRVLNRYSSGEALFTENEDTLRRLACIIGIQQALNSAFPHNPDMANYWATSNNMYFGNRTPLDIMIAHGLDGMQNMLNHLNGDQGW